MNAITTDFARANQAKAAAGEEALKTVAKMSFGNGGTNPDGSVRTPLSSETGLANKLLAVDIESVTYPIPTTVRFTARLAFDQLNGYEISEIGLESADGTTLAIKTFEPIPKNSENEFVVDWDEVY